MSAHGVNPSTAQAIRVCQAAMNFPNFRSIVHEIQGYESTSLREACMLLMQLDKFVEVGSSLFPLRNFTFNADEAVVLGLVGGAVEPLQNWLFEQRFGLMFFVVGNNLGACSMAAPLSNPLCDKAIVFTERISSREEEPVYKTSKNKVFKIFLTGSQLELLLGKFIPGVFKMELIGRCGKPTEFCFMQQEAVAPGRLVAMMPFSNGTLAKQITTGGIARAREIAESIFPQLMIMHFLGLAHNDIKPNNVLEAPNTTDKYKWQLNDFGHSMPWSTDAPSSFYDIMGTPYYQYRHLQHWFICPHTLRDSFALAALLYEAIVNENKSLSDYQIYMTHQQTCLKFTDFYRAVFANKGDTLLQQEFDFFVRRIERATSDPVICETIRRLVHIEPLDGTFGMKTTTNIFSAASAFFGAEFPRVLDDVLTTYTNYCREAAKTMRTWPNSVDLVAMDPQKMAPPVAGMAFSLTPMVGSNQSFVNSIFRSLTPLVGPKWIEMRPIMAPFPSWRLVSLFKERSTLEERMLAVRNQCVAHFEAMTPDTARALITEIDPSFKRI